MLLVPIFCSSCRSSSPPPHVFIGGTRIVGFTRNQMNRFGACCHLWTAPNTNISIFYLINQGNWIEMLMIKYIIYINLIYRNYMEMVSLNSLFWFKSKSMHKYTLLVTNLQQQKIRISKTTERSIYLVGILNLWKWF